MLQFCQYSPINKLLRQFTNIDDEVSEYTGMAIQGNALEAVHVRSERGVCNVCLRVCFMSASYIVRYCMCQYVSNVCADRIRGFCSMRRTGLGVFVVSTGLNYGCRGARRVELGFLLCTQGQIRVCVVCTGLN